MEWTAATVFFTKGETFALLGNPIGAALQRSRANGCAILGRDSLAQRSRFLQILTDWSLKWQA